MADINDIQAAQTVKVVGSDGAGVEQTPVKSDTEGRLHTVTKVWRPSEVDNRVKVTIPVVNLTLGNGSNIVYTVTSGYRLHITSFLVTALNESVQEGIFNLRDDTTDRVGFAMPSRLSGSIQSTLVSSSGHLSETLSFDTNVNYLEVTGSIKVSGYLIGYEELL